MARSHNLRHLVFSRLLLPTAYCLLPALLLAVGCSTTLNRSGASNNPPIVRVRLHAAQEQLTVVASQPPIYRTESDPTPRLLGLPKNTPVPIILTANGWRVGGTTIGAGILTLQPAAEGTVSIQPATGDASVTSRPRPYRGTFKLVPAANGKFDVVNEVDIDGYLAGVLPRELLKQWNEETYKAQAIVARTYALYEKATAASANRAWDLYPDERSQVYGGMADETDKSRRAVNETIGIVVTYAPQGQQPHIFKAYFSSCCGGVSQSAMDAFNESFSEPLQEQDNHGICNASPRFTWGPIVVSKKELTRRVKAWGKYRNRLEKDMGTIQSVVVQEVNAWGRPTRFVISDDKVGYILWAEEFRAACNWDAQDPNITHGVPAPTLYSSFVKVITDADDIRFVEGHGFGHGVGLCQWCSQRRAEEGMTHEDIVLAAYPRAKLMRAY